MENLREGKSLYDDEFDLEKGCRSVFVSKCIVVFCSLDIVFTMNASYIEEAVVELSRRKIQKNYMQTWFAFDIVTYTSMIHACGKAVLMTKLSTGVRSLSGPTA